MHRKRKMPKKIQMTGTAGFIASHMADWLMALGHDVAGIDNL